MHESLEMHPQEQPEARPHVPPFTLKQKAFIQAALMHRFVKRTGREPEEWVERNADDFRLLATATGKEQEEAEALRAAFDEDETFTTHLATYQPKRLPEAFFLNCPLFARVEQYLEREQRRLAA